MAKKKNRFRVTIDLESTDVQDSVVLDKICALFDHPTQMVQVAESFSSPAVRRKQFELGDLIEVDVRGFEYQPRHYVELDCSGCSTGKRFKERPTVEELEAG